MSDTPNTCASCGRTRDDVRVLVRSSNSYANLALCPDCIRGFDDGLTQAMEDESRRRGAVSESVMAEELALNLMDALDASRDEREAREGFDWSAANTATASSTDSSERPAPHSHAPPPEPTDVGDVPDELTSPTTSEGSAGVDPAVAAHERAAPPPRKVAAVIPARYASTRFPGKPLHVIAGKPLIQHVWERAKESNVFAEILVATDDERIAEAVRGFGGTAVMTSVHAKSGTDRIAEIAKSRPDLTHFVNIQGDEPLVHPDMLAALSGTFEDPDVEMATLVRPLEEDERHNPNVVKVVQSRFGDALYFSRADIPFQREPDKGFPHRYAHIGLYGYSRAALLDLARHPASPLEEVERLEQLRALEIGITIRCLMTLHRTIGVDTPEDAQKVEALLAHKVPASTEGTLPPAPLEATETTGPGANDRGR